METNQQATASNTTVWFELDVQDSHGKWITVSDHDTREQAETAELPAWARDSKIRKVRGYNSDA